MKPEKNIKNVKAKNEKISKKNKGNRTLIIGALAVILLAGIAYAVLSGGPTSSVDSSKKMMSLKEVRAAIDAKYGSNPSLGTNTPPVVDNYVPRIAPKIATNLPSYAYTNPMTLKAYKYASEHPEILEQIACYCGCGGHSGHRFLRDCFINDDGTFGDHASFCDVCVGEALMAQELLPNGITPAAPVPAVQASTDLSALSLPGNFKSLADGLKLTSAGANRAYFVNTKMLVGTQLETQILTGMSREDGFYGKKLMGMYSADFNTDSWIELHDLGYDNTKGTALIARQDQGMKNIVYTRPLIYGHSQNADKTLKLMADPNSMATSYPAYEPLLDAVDYRNAGVALVMKENTSFSDMNYWSMTPFNDKVELVKAYNVTSNKSVPADLSSYNPQFKGNILIIKVTGDLTTVNNEKDKIESIAK
jgi:hypothetical protein